MKRTERLVSLLAMNATINCLLGKQTELRQPKIVGGYALNVQEVPYLLALYLRNGGFQCGAVILSSSWGISALHCVRPGTAGKDYFVRAGSSLQTAGGSLHAITKFYPFDTQYVTGTAIPVHDIVLFKVKGRFRFSAKVRPALLPQVGTAPPELLRVSGWGSTDVLNEGHSSVHLRAANVMRITWKDCIAESPSYGSIVSKKRHLCYGAESADACWGDSGGPLADSQYLYGIVSFGDGCAVAPGVYTKVSYYRRWIKRVTKV